MVSVVVVVTGGLVVWRKLPDWTHIALASAVEGSELSAEDKLSVLNQLDRVRDQYKSGDITLRQLGGVAEQLAESRVFPLALAHAAVESYVQPSGLSDEEKQAAMETLKRVARGLYEDKIDQNSLDTALDYISTKGYDGQRQFSDQVSDADLREMLAECMRLADDAGVSGEPFAVDVGGELKRAVDQSIAEPPNQS